MNCSWNATMATRIAEKNIVVRKKTRKVSQPMGRMVQKMSSMKSQIAQAETRLDLKTRSGIFRK